MSEPSAKKAAARKLLQACFLEGFALIAGLIYVLAGAPPMAVLGLMGACAAFRWLHSLCYLKSIQPLRSISFGMAALATAGMLIHSVVLVAQAG